MMQPHRVTVVTPVSGTDRRSDTTLDYGDAATRAVVRAFLQQGSTSEQLGDRDVSKSTWTLFSSHTPNLTTLNQIEWNSLTFQVTGKPDHLANGSTGAYDHTQADLTLVEG